MRYLAEQTDIDKIIKDLVDKDLSGSNEKQMGAIQLLKGLATSEEPKSNEFMKKLDDAITKIGKEMLGEPKEEMKNVKKESKSFYRGQLR